MVLAGTSRFARKCLQRILCKLPSLTSACFAPALVCISVHVHMRHCACETRPGLTWRERVEAA